MAAVDTKDFLDPRVLSRLLSLSLEARSPMEGTVSGRHQSPHRGSSVEFAEYRKYVPGDDVRHLDWRVYARTDRFYMKEFEADTNLRCYLVLDASGSMNYQAEHGTKFGYARKLAAALAYLAMHQGDAVGLACCSAELVRDIPPRRNAAHLQNIYRVLAETTPSGTTGLVAGLHQIAERIRRRALVLVFSDLFAEPGELLRCFQHLRFRKHDVAVFHLLDRTELEFGFDRPTRFVDLEDGSTVLVEPSLIREQYQAAVHAYLERLRDGCRENRVDYRLVTTDRDVERVLADFLLARLRR